MALGGWFMQQAYACALPQLAVASVTVVDPIVAVLLGVVLLGEASGVPWWVGVGELVAGAVAIGGVIALAVTQARPQSESTLVAQVMGPHEVATAVRWAAAGGSPSNPRELAA